MRWELQYQDRRQARIVKAGGQPVSGFLDWTTAQAIVTEHNRDLEAAGSIRSLSVEEIKHSNTPEARLAWDQLQASTGKRS